MAYEFYKAKLAGEKAAKEAREKEEIEEAKHQRLLQDIKEGKDTQEIIAKLKTENEKLKEYIKKIENNSNFNFNDIL
jgi:ketol-acid reductoisomerase